MSYHPVSFHLCLVSTKADQWMLSAECPHFQAPQGPMTCPMWPIPSQHISKRIQSVCLCGPRLYPLGNLICERYCFKRWVETVNCFGCKLTLKHTCSKLPNHMKDLAFFPQLAERQADPCFRFHQHSYLPSASAFSLPAVSQGPRKCKAPPGAGKHAGRLGSWLEQLSFEELSKWAH